MLFLLYLVVRVLARLLGTSSKDDRAKDLEILVLRHQLRVLQRTSGPPKFRAIDRVLLVRLRAASAEWVNALARNRRFQQFRVRGLEKVRSVLLWFALAHNLDRTLAIRARTTG